MAADPEEWVARWGHGVLIDDIGTYRFKDVETERWVRRWWELMTDSKQWPALRERHLDAAERRGIEAQIEEMRDPDYDY